MIFIKKCLRNGEPQKMELFQSTTSVGDTFSHHIDMKLPDGKAIRMFSSSLDGIEDAIKNSLKHIAKNTDIEKATTAFLNDDITEVSLYIRNKKITMEPTAERVVPIEIKCVPEKDDNNEDIKKFPKDMIVFVCDKIDNTKIVIDKRNLISQPVIADCGNYYIILVMIRWPNWSILKFPIYMYIEQDGVVQSAIKLGFRVTDKGNKRNQLINCDEEEAKENLNKILKKHERKPKIETEEVDDDSERSYRHKQKHNWSRSNPRDSSGFRGSDTDTTKSSTGESITRTKTRNFKKKGYRHNYKD